MFHVFKQKFGRNEAEQNALEDKNWNPWKYDQFKETIR